MTGWTRWAKPRHLDSLEAMPACARRRFTAAILDASSSNVAQIPEIQVCRLPGCVLPAAAVCDAHVRTPLPATGPDARDPPRLPRGLRQTALAQHAKHIPEQHDAEAASAEALQRRRVPAARYPSAVPSVGCRDELR